LIVDLFVAVGSQYATLTTLTTLTIRSNIWDSFESLVFGLG